MSLFNVAVPFDIESLKSDTSKFPFPVLVLKTVSVNVTVAVLLSAAVTTPVIVGASLSFKALVLLLCVVAATFPDPS